LNSLAREKKKWKTIVGYGAAGQLTTPVWEKHQGKERGEGGEVKSQ
jgi:hypothetical protein